ncbi:MAG: hypothetical protein HY712_07150 [candidate division NC10 bacterium]|nr:hypothetical protein [candidate division NC10 bacterium]
MREHLRGGRVPADVYLLRKLQTQDPDAGPVERRSAPEEAVLPPQPEPVPPAPAPAQGETEPLVIPDPLALFQDVADAARLPTAEPAEAPEPEREARFPLEPPSKAPPQRGVEAFLRFGAPLPPTTRTAEELPRLIAWMLEHDPVIPNNLSRLDAIHAAVFDGQPAGRLSYEEHLLFQVTDDLWLHPTQDALDAHLAVVFEGYRRAAEAYHDTAGAEGDDGALWRLSSAVSRIRIEAWIYHTLYGAPPRLVLPGRRRRAMRPPR